jgi:hypothetical protein
MSYSSDELGEWRFVGEVEPLYYYEWYDFPFDETPVASGEYRATFLSSNLTKITSWAWLRSIIFKGASEIVQPSRRVYPKRQPMALTFRIPPWLQGQGVSQQRFQIMKIRRRGYDWRWRLRLEELQAPANDSEVVFRFRLREGLISAHPEDPELIITKFVLTTGFGDRRFEIGRFYYADTSIEVSDPFIKFVGVDRVEFFFTGTEPTPNDAIDVVIFRA